MLLLKGKRLAICYGFVLIATMLLLVLLSTGQASLNIHNSHAGRMHPASHDRAPLESGDILMGHPALDAYIPGNFQSDEILKILIAAESDESVYAANYPIQYKATSQPRTKNFAKSIRHATEL